MDPLPRHQTSPRGSAEAGKGPKGAAWSCSSAAGERALSLIYESLERSGSGENCVCYAVSSPLRLLGVAPGAPGPCACAPRVCSLPDGGGGGQTPGGRAGVCAGALGQLEALRVEAVALRAGHGLQQSLLLLQAARRLQLIHGGQVEEHALVQVLPRVPPGHGLQLPQRVLEAAQVQQAHSCVVAGLGGGAGLGGCVRVAQGPPALEGA